MKQHVMLGDKPISHDTSVETSRLTSNFTLKHRIVKTETIIPLLSQIFLLIFTLRSLYKLFIETNVAVLVPN